MKILVCGDRLWMDRETIRCRLTDLARENIDGYRTWTIIHGAARGADSIAGEEGKKLGFKVVEFPANWERYGKSAGPLRNLRMLMENPDLVIAFHDDLSKSRGTAHTVRESRKRGIRVEVIKSASK